VTATWSDIRVGHVIRINRDEIVPADVIILETMDSKHQCYVDVSAINGVFDRFITKKACSDTQIPEMKQVKFTEYVKNIKGMLKYEEPDANLNSFKGRLKLEVFPRASDVNEENFVMRGSTIKNVKCVYGLVVYTGMETKIMQIIKNDKTNSNIVKQVRNTTATSLKIVQLIILLIYILVILLVTLAYFEKIHFIKFKEDHYYLELFTDGTSATGVESNSSYYMEYFFTFLQFLFTFQLLIPFTWLNMILIAYYILSLFIRWDIKIRQKPHYTVDIINKDCLTQFGKVKYILADKTGTLTSRKFILKACSIRGKLYSFDPIDRKDETDIFRHKDFEIAELEIYQELKSNSLFSNYIKEFLEYLSICHTVKLTNSTKQADVINNEHTFGSCYAEEIATLKMIKKLGFVLSKTKNDYMMVESIGEMRTYPIIGINKFSEERKRMSVIVKRNKRDNESLLVCKGYDLTIFNFIKKDNESIQEIKMMKEQIKKLTHIGYRYIIFCKKELSEDETLSYMSKHKSAENYILQREVHFENLANDYEFNMELLGVLFFEEKIPQELRFSINKLNDSNINVWIVSGDRKENVMAVSENLEMNKSTSLKVEFYEKDDLDELDIKMNMFLLQFVGDGQGEQMMRMKTRKGVEINVEAGTSVKKSKNKELTIYIHGICFARICGDNRLYQCFTMLLTYTTNLVAYSFSPNNKFQLCKTVKQFIAGSSKVLAIGDGLNDFMMLKEADLSIGIRSREILQVRNTCDIIVSKFPQIVDLILVQGTWNLDRIYNICFYSIYANLLILLPFLFEQFNINIGSSFLSVDYLKFTLDILIIDLFIILVICFDQNIERPLIGLNPAIYQMNVKTKDEIFITLIKHITRAIIDSLIVFYFFYSNTTAMSNILGSQPDAFIYGNVINYTTYIVILVKFSLVFLHTFNIAILITIVLAAGSLAGLAFISQDVLISSFETLSYLSIVLTVFFIVSLTVIYENSIKHFKYFVNPDFIDILTSKFKKYVDGKDYLF
jgi:phospholipid-translocating P-type ATPase (flippase)